MTEERAAEEHQDKERRSLATIPEPWESLVRPAGARPKGIRFSRVLLLSATVLLALSALPWGLTFAQEPASQAKGAEPLKIWAQPTGQLVDTIPSEIVFRVSDTQGLSVQVGREISPSLARESIRFSPEVSGKIIWLSQNNMAYRFQEPLRPGQRYDFEVKSIPVSDDQRIPISPASFHFITPTFHVIGASLLEWSKYEVSARVRCNLPIQWIGAEDFVSVATPSGEQVVIRALRKGGSDKTFDVFFKNTGQKTYEVVVRQGLASALPGVKLEKDARLSLASPEREVYVSRITPEESGAGYTINVIANVQGSAGCTFDRNVDQYLEIQPAVTVRVQYHNQGFRLIGDFLPEQTYQVTIRAGLTAGTATLRRDFVQQVRMPAPSPQVRFAVRGRYLGRHLGAKLPVRTRAVSDLSVSVWRLPLENLTWASEYGFPHSVNQFGEPVVKDRKVGIETGDRKQGTQLTWLELSDLIDTSEPGLYQVQVRRFVPKDERRRQNYNAYSYGQMTDVALVVITDLALITKNSRDKVWVWAVDAGTGQPRSRVQLKLYSQKNVLMGTGVTDKEGYCEIPFEPVRDRSPRLVTAMEGGDFSYIDLEPSSVSLQPFSVSGVQPGEVNYRAFFYPERNLYRPGETLHFAVLLREESTFRGLSLPVKVSVRDPLGKHLTDLTQTTDFAGLAGFELSLPQSTPTGNYAFNVIVGEKAVASGSIFVETFVPERMHVEVNAAQTQFRAGEPIGFHVQADYLFGAPASGEGYKFNVTAKETAFSVKKLPGYRFGKIRDTRTEPPTAKVTGEGVLNAKGAADATASIRDWSAFFNQADARVSVEVEEAGSGRVSRSWTNVKVHPFPYYIGLKPGDSRLQPGKPVAIKGVVVDYDGGFRKDVNDLVCQIYEVHHDYVRAWDPESNRFSWQYSAQRFPVGNEGSVKVREGRFEVSLVPKTYWVDYLVEVRDRDGASAGELMVYGWSRYGQDDRPESPETLEIRVQKPGGDRPPAAFDYGETAEAEALLPFEGKMLWTVELDGVLKHEWKEARGEVARFSFSIPEGVTSVYVSALLTRTDKQYLVRRAFGVERVSVRPAKHRLPLQVDVPESARPGSTLNVHLQGKGRYRATVAIVDEGILQLTRFQTPDVYEGILRDQGLGIRTAETLGWIVNKAMAVPGGGEAGAMGLEYESMIRLVSFWSGIVESDDKGSAAVRFTLPQYLGKLRVMVEAMDESRLASVEKSVTVTTEVVVLPTPPRFVYSGDRLEFPVALKNTTDQVQGVKFKVRVEEQGAGTERETKITLNPKATEILRVPLQAHKQAGVVSVAVTADWGLDRYSDTVKVPVLPSLPFERDAGFTPVKAGTHDLKPYVSGWIAEFQKTRITVVPTLALGQLHHLQYLIQYPYGCVEQTSSSLLPMVRMKPLLKLMASDSISESDLAQKVHAGIGRLSSMQTLSGGFAFWPGGRDPQVWASIYATFVLLEARDAGYVVPDTVLGPALQYIQRSARQNAFGYFVLAKGGSLQPGDVEDMLALVKRNISSEDRFFLAGALYLGGRPSSAAELLKEALTYAPAKSSFRSRTFHSTLREYGVRLYMRELIHPGAAENEADTVALTRMLRRRSYYYSTQELAWTMLALGTRVQNSNYSQDYEANLLVNGAVMEPQKTKQGPLWLIRSAGDLKDLQLQVKGEGTVYAMTENAGFRTGGKYEAFGDNGLLIEKRFLDATGGVPASFKQKAVYFVEITVTNRRSVNLENAALEDFIPAGFEVENPRLPGTAKAEFLRKPRLFQPEYVDYRDERVQAFGSLPPGKTTYFYMVRAVTPGEFMLPPANAVTMYDPEVRAGSAAGRITIER